MKSGKEHAPELIIFILHVFKERNCFSKIQRRDFSHRRRKYGCGS
jgi:hypothetical protein